MPNNTGTPFWMSGFFFLAAFFAVFNLWIPAIISMIGVFGFMIHRSFEKIMVDTFQLKKLWQLRKA